MASQEHDGLTTNGIAFMRPIGTFEWGVSPGEWREVTVMGNVRKLRAQRSSRTPGEPVRESLKKLGRVKEVVGLLLTLCTHAKFLNRVLLATGCGFSTGTIYCFSWH